MVYDPASPSSAAASMLDAAIPEPPPSYADVEAESAGPSSSAGGEWPSSLTPLFTGPPNAEPLISRDRAAGLAHIATAKMMDRFETCDPRLQNPDVLYDFLRAETLKAPTVQARAAAFHWETSPRTQLIVEGGVPRQVQAGQRYRVTDFDFTIDLSSIVEHDSNAANISLFTLPTTIPARRGQLGRTFGASVAPFPGSKAIGRTPSREEKRRWDAYATFRHERGRAPWSDIADDEEFWTGYNRSGGGIALGGRESDEEALLSSQPGEGETALRAWCEAYVADEGPMKEFKLTKVVYGWDIAALRKAIMGAIHSTGYIAEDENSIRVDITVSEGDVIVRPNNLLSLYQYGSGTLHVVLMMLFFWALPLLWLWQRLDSRAGGPYEMAIAAYGMKVYPALPNTFRNESVAQAQHRVASLFKTHPEIPANPRLQKGPKGVHYLLGEREGLWFRQWEERIRMAVRMRYSGKLEDPRVIDDGLEGPELDGYAE